MKRFITSFLLLGALFNVANSQPNPTKTIHVTVKNSATDGPVNETEVTYKDFNGTQRKITNSQGRVTFQVKLLTNPMEASIELNDAISGIVAYVRKATKVKIELKEEQDVYEVAAIFHSDNKGITISVTDAEKGSPLAGAKVTLSKITDGKDESSYTDVSGNASFEVLLNGDNKTVPVIVEKSLYEPLKTTVQLNYRKDKNLLNIALEKDKNIRILRVKVISTPDLLPVVGASVVANGKGFHGFATGSTDDAGVATLPIETGGEFLVTVKHGNFNEEQKTVTIKQFGEDKETILPFEVKRKNDLKRDLKVYVFEKTNSGDQPVAKIAVLVNGRPGITGSDGIAEFRKILFMGEIGKIEIPPSDIYEGANENFLGGGDQTRYLPAEQDATLIYLKKKPETYLTVTVRVLDEKTMSPVGGVVTQIRLAEGTLTPYDTTYANGERNIKINKKYLVNAPLRLFVDRKKGYEDKWVDITADFLNPPQDGKTFTVFIKKINNEKGRDLKVLVRDAKTLLPVPKATVNLQGNNVATDGTGLAVFSAISTAGEEKTIYITATGYEQKEKDYKAGTTPSRGGSAPVDEVEVLLQKKPARALFTVQVLDNVTNKPIPGASAVIKLYSGTAVSDKEKTDIKGEADLEVSEGAPANGQFRLVASADNYEEKWNDIPNSYLDGKAEKKVLQVYLKIKQGYPGMEVKYGPFPANLNGWLSTGLKFKKGGTFKVEVDKDSKITVPDENDNTKRFVRSPAGGRWEWFALKAKIGIDIQPIFNTGGYVDKDGILELGVPRMWTFYPQDAVGASGQWMVYVITSDAEQTSTGITTTETAPVKNDNSTNPTQLLNEKTEKAKKDLEFLKRIAKGEMPANGSVEMVMLGITYLMSEYKLFFSPLGTSNDCTSTIKNYLEYIWTQKGIPSPNHKYEYSGCINPLITDLEYKINNNLIK